MKQRVNLEFFENKKLVLNGLNIIDRATSACANINFSDTVFPCTVREKSKPTDKINYAGELEVENIEKKACA